MKTIALRYLGLFLIISGAWLFAYTTGYLLPDYWLFTQMGTEGGGQMAHWWSIPTLLSVLYCTSIFSGSGFYLLLKDYK